MEDDRLQALHDSLKEQKSARGKHGGLGSAGIAKNLKNTHICFDDDETGCNVYSNFVRSGFLSETGAKSEIEKNSKKEEYASSRKKKRKETVAEPISDDPEDESDSAKKKKSKKAEKKSKNEEAEDPAAKISKKDRPKGAVLIKMEKAGKKITSPQNFGNPRVIYTPKGSKTSLKEILEDAYDDSAEFPILVSCWGSIDKVNLFQSSSGGTSLKKIHASMIQGAYHADADESLMWGSFYSKEDSISIQVSSGIFDISTLKVGKSGEFWTSIQASVKF